MDKKMICKYGASCYRNNPGHLKKYSHEPEKNDQKEKQPVKKRRLDNSPKMVLRQTKLDFFRQAKPLDVRREAGNRRMTKEDADDRNTTNSENEESSSRKEPKHQTPTSPPKARREAPVSPSKKSPKRKRTPSPKKRATVIEESSENESEDENGVCDVTSNSWTFEKNSETKDERSTSPSPQKSQPQDEMECKTPAEIIKKLFLVEMPEDFYTFFEFCEMLNGKNPKEALRPYGLRLVGPFDVLTGELSQSSVSAEEALCHWRFYMDPPEMQTVMVGEKGLHYGYWRDDPSTKQPFVVSNTVPSCTIHPVAANLFGAALTHMTGYIRHCTPFEKVKANKVVSSMKQWAEDREIDLSDCTEIIRERKKNVVAATFHGLGIVVPVQPETEIGYRPLIETNANLKKLCHSIMKAKSPDESQSKMDNLERLVTAANIANDECDFGNGLELGIDLFCMGSDVFHDLVKHLLTNAYTLLERPEWATIIKAHLKNRRTGLQLSAIKQNRR